jgi:hypothetical protein
MKSIKTKPLWVPLVLAAFALPGAAQQQQQPPPPQPQGPMSFFVTSVGKGDGANLGGLAGADAHCQQLGSAAGRGNVTWRAYLSQAAAAGQGGAPALPQVHARDRIGTGPWFNARGVPIAWNVDDLHEDRNNIRKPTALNEKGEEVKGVGDQPNMHDILTGSDSRGRLVPGNTALTTCNNWTSNTMGNAIVGHHDRLGGPSASWNSVHSTRSCSQEDLVATGGAGLFYCFAIN